MSLPRRIVALVQHFTQHIDSFKGNNYNETRARIEFIDPFFKELGWDIENAQGFAETYKEVIHEDAIKVEGSTKAPDYSFRIGGQRKFFLEAKRPSVNVKDDVGPAYQLRRYAWNAGLPVSILTDFEEFAIYDTSIRPNPKDKASTARIFYCTFKDYEQQWDYIASIFSKEAILKGSFEQFLTDSKRRKGTTAVDKEFLKEMEKWRTDLAKNVALRNNIEIHALNYVVQATIDRILFLRICEDRNIEEYGRLHKLAGATNIYKKLTEFFQQADEKYNSGLFHFHKEKDNLSEPDEVSLNLKIDDKILKEIINALYFPSPYEFSVISADILGNVYEQFLGKVIRLTASGQAKIEEKPEVKKAGGVYYTPQYIVKYIVENTLGELLKEKTPMMVAGKVKGHTAVRILDPACGSGSFLIFAYQFLLDWHRDWYEKDIKQKGEAQAKKWSDAVYQGPGDHWYLTTREKKRILLNNIYGIDIDQQAVEVTKLNLLLKVLEGENRETLGTNLKLFHERALPDLSPNIKCGNSLIGTDLFILTPDSAEKAKNIQQNLFEMSAEEKYELNALDWQNEFSDILKDGGFNVIIGNPPWGAEFNEIEKKYLTRKFPEIPSKVKDSYLYFVSQALKLLADKAYFGYITPNTWLLINSCAEFRKAILAQNVLEIYDLGDGIFQEATVESSIITIQKKLPIASKCRAKLARNHQVITDQVLEKSIWLKDEFSRIILDLNVEKQEILEKLSKISQPFDEVATINWGIKPYQVGYGIPAQTKEMMANRVYHASTPKGKDWKPLVVGKDVDRYRIDFNGDQYIKYGKWLMYPSNQEIFEGEKIFLRQTSDILRAAYDNTKLYCQNSVFIIASNKVDLKFLTALLNSTLFNFVYKLKNPQPGKTFPEIKPSAIKELPIHLGQSALVTKIVQIHDELVKLNKSISEIMAPDEKVRMQRLVDAAVVALDAAIYQLYDLSDQEINVVRSAS